MIKWDFVLAIFRCDTFVLEIGKVTWWRSHMGRVQISVSLSCFLSQLLRNSEAGAMAGLPFEPLQVSQPIVGFRRHLLIVRTD